MWRPKKRKLPHGLGGGLPPLDVFWSYRRRSETDLNLIKATRAALIWRSVAWPDRIRIYRRCLRWLFRYPQKLVTAVTADGKDTRRRYGRSVLGQVRDILRVSLVNGLEPRDYYRAALARYGGGAEILRYPPFVLVRVAAQGLTDGKDGASSADLNNKTAFADRCRVAGLPVVRTIAIARQADTQNPEGAKFEGFLPDRDLIIKPEDGGQGRDIEGWRSAGAGRFSNADAQTLSGSDLLKRAASMAKAHGDAMLVQERLENHEDLRPFSGSALSTTRVVTMINEADEPEIVDAFFRTSVEPQAVVDNFHNGGVLFPIDTAAGLFLPGMTDAAFDQRSIEFHPQTGRRMAGCVHPKWREVAELALNLHRIYTECVMPGWDIAVGPDGAVALELNFPPGISLNRQPTFGGLVGTRMLSLLGFHAKNWLECNEPPTSRWRFGIDSRPVPPRAPSSPQAARPTSRSPNSSAASSEKNRRSHSSRLTI